MICNSCVLDTRVIFSQSKAPPRKPGRARFIQIFKYSNIQIYLKMATRLDFAGRWTEKRHHSTFVCRNIIK